MKISNYNQLLATSTLISGMIIFAVFWNQYQKVEGISRSYSESQLLVQTVEHLFTMSQTWLTTQDLLYSGRQSYLAKGINEQSVQLVQMLVAIQQKVIATDTGNLVKQLITAIEKNDSIVNSFSQLSMQDIRAWRKAIEDSDDITRLYVAQLELLNSQIAKENNYLFGKLAIANSDIKKLISLLVTLYLLFVLITVTWFSKYIIKPIENITALALNSSDSENNIEFRQENAPKEIMALSLAIQQFSQRITFEKKMAQQERLNVSRANEKANIIMDTIPCSLLLLNKDGMIKECNNETSKLFSKKKDRIIERNIADFLPALATVDGQFDQEMVISNMEESLLATNMNNPHIEFSGRKIIIKEAINYLLTISDINERKHSQRALSALSEQLVNAEKLASIGQLSTGIAHEINNPVGYIRSNLDMLSDYFKPLLLYINLVNNNDDKESAQRLYQKEDLNFIINDIEPLINSTIEGAARVSKIIKDLGNYAHVDDKAPEPMFIDELIEQSLTLVANELKYKVEIIKSLDAKVRVLGFPQKLLQVFINMLVNASHAIENKGRISIISSTEQGEVNISFEDNGSGIAREHLKKIFDPFFTTKPVGKGTGLGLHIVRTIIEDHHGRIDVNSIVGKGSKFEIYLPIYQS